ncbi:MAG: nitrogen fixation protein NifS [Pseudooceanicola sp.]|jgi:selenocysteine lyase/cysteine desulfurase|nr:nitrogen fixation protein NifS [Pseudooceanicola sp.]|tara:strand:+ start:283 stop:1506 length:1224 start_codon:yes stop_codon:yes gene_type:complete
MKMDTDFVRAQFPAFQQPSLAGFANFENAGGSYTCGAVIDRLTRYYTERKTQPYGPSAPSQAGGEEIDDARARLSAMLGIESDELSFGPSTTQNTYVLSQAFRKWMSPGEAIIVTNQDHEANSGPWRRLAEDGIEIREWRMDPATGTLNPEDLEPLLDEKVRLVCFPHCSNVIGEINPVTEITAMAHAAGAFVCVDGVSYAPHGLPDVGSLGPDIYLFSAYKTYGPHLGLMAIRRNLGELLPNQGHHFNGGVLYQRFTPAGPDHAQIAACAGMADYFDALCDHHGGPATGAAARGAFVHDLMRARETELLQPLMDAVKSRNAVRLLGPDTAAHRAPTVALALHGDPVDVNRALADRGIIANASNFYAGRALSGVGLDEGQEVLRLSFTHYTSDAELSKLLDAVDALL